MSEKDPTPSSSNVYVGEFGTSGAGTSNSRVPWSRKLTKVQQTADFLGTANNAGWLSGPRYGRQAMATSFEEEEASM